MDQLEHLQCSNFDLHFGCYIGTHIWCHVQSSGRATTWRLVMNTCIKEKVFVHSLKAVKLDA